MSVATLAEPAHLLRQQTHGSTCNEQIYEHLLLGAIGVELMMRGADYHELHATRDTHGYDVVLESGALTRHVQLKSTLAGSTTREIPINTRLASRPSACVIWSVFDPDLRGFSEFRWFGGEPGTPLPKLGDRPVRHSRANADGIKAIRPGMRGLTLPRFERLATIGQLVDRLFGPLV